MSDTRLPKCLSSRAFSIRKCSNVGKESESFEHYGLSRTLFKRLSIYRGLDCFCGCWICSVHSSLAICPQVAHSHHIHAYTPFKQVIMPGWSAKVKLLRRGQSRRAQFFNAWRMRLGPCKTSFSAELLGCLSGTSSTIMRGLRIW